MSNALIWKSVKECYYISSTHTLWYLHKCTIKAINYIIDGTKKRVSTFNTEHFSFDDMLVYDSYIKRPITRLSC